jgi:hypothetical protein
VDSAGRDCSTWDDRKGQIIMTSHIMRIEHSEDTAQALGLSRTTGKTSGVAATRWLYRETEQEPECDRRNGPQAPHSWNKPQTLFKTASDDAG